MLPFPFPTQPTPKPSLTDAERLQRLLFRDPLPRDDLPQQVRTGFQHVATTYDLRKALRFLDQLCLLQTQGNLSLETIKAAAEADYSRVEVEVKNVPLAYLAAITMIRSDFPTQRTKATKPVIQQAPDGGPWQLLSQYEGPQGHLHFVLERPAHWSFEVAPDVYDFFETRNPSTVDFTPNQGLNLSPMQVRLLPDPKHYIERCEEARGFSQELRSGKDALEQMLTAFYGETRALDIHEFVDYLRQKKIVLEE